MTAAISRTLVLSDLHLGNGGPYDSYAGGDALPKLLDSLGGPLRVIVNGDGLDFLMNDDPLELDEARAIEQARQIVAWPESGAALAALGRVLARGGEVTIRVGNHDPELALPGVQAVLRAAMGQPAALAGRLAFACEEAPCVLAVGGARILITHGDHDDPFNTFDREAIPRGQRFVYSPGSRLVKRIINRVLRDFQLSWVNYLKPDFQGAVLCALGVEPRCLDLAIDETSIDTLTLLLKNLHSLRRRIQPEDETPAVARPQVGKTLEGIDLPQRLLDAGLSRKEIGALIAARGRVLGMAAAVDPLLARARMKLARANLQLFGAVHRRLTGGESEAYFALEPTDAEWRDARRLARTHGAQAVVIGHTHAARFRDDEALVYVNTGTWIWLMGLPSPQMSDDEWVAFVEELSENRGLVKERQRLARLTRRLTAALIEPHERCGALLSLVEQGATGLNLLHRAQVPAAP